MAAVNRMFDSGKVISQSVGNEIELKVFFDSPNSAKAAFIELDGSELPNGELLDIQWNG